MTKTQKSNRTLMILLVMTIFFSIYSIDVIAANDTLAPSIVYSSPQGYLATTAIALNAVTDETAMCRYGTSDSDYSSMPDSFGTNGTNHNVDLVLSQGTYSYYVRCQDQSNNTMSTSEHISFTIDTEVPSIISSKPVGTITQNHATLEIVTSEKAICRYDTQDKPYSLMTSLFENTNSTLHQHELFNLASNEYTYYARCRDYANNEASTTIQFNINLPPTFSIKIEETPPIKEGTYEIEVYSSKKLISAPVLEYKFDDEDRKYDVSLVGLDNLWKGYIIIPEFPKNRVGRFMISGKDYDGLTGTRITSGELFLVDTVDPIAPESLNIISYDSKIEIDWDYQGEPADEFIIFRARASGVETVDYYDTVKTNKYLDTQVDPGNDYYYRVCAVDGSDNRGELSKEIRITAVGKKEKEVEIPTLSRDLEIELNSTIEKFKSDIMDFDTYMKKLERMTKEEEKLVLDTFDLVDQTRKAKEDYQELIKTLDGLRKLDLSRNDFNERISSAKDNADDLKTLVVKSIDIINSVDFQETSSDKERESIRTQALEGIELDGPQLDNFTKKSERLETDAKIYSKIVSAKISYLDGKTKEYTIFSKDIITDDEKDVWVMESIPKEVSKQADDIQFSKKPIIMKNDPLVRWEYKILNELNLQYYVEGIISLDDASKVRTHLVYDPRIFIEDKTETANEENKVTGNSIFDIKALLGKIKLSIKDLFMPIVGFMIVVGLLVYYFFFLKEETLGEEHNLRIDIPEEKPKQMNSSINHTIIPVKLNLHEKDKEELDNYHHLINMIDHANTNADNMNMEIAKKEYLLIYNLFNKLDFKDEHTKRGVKNNVITLYNKIILWQKINNILSNGHNIQKEKLHDESKTIGVLLSMIHNKQDTVLTNYAQDYYNYIERIKEMTSKR